MAEESSSSRACRVVICDDAEPYRTLLAMVLGFEPDLEIVGQAENGAEAVERSRELRPDVLLLDVSMPVMDGLEALPLVRQASPDTVVLMVTGLTAPDVRERALALGAADFIDKAQPFDKLTERIRVHADCGAARG